MKNLTFPGVTAGTYTVHLGLTKGLTTVLRLSDKVKQTGLDVGSCCQLCTKHAKCAYWTWKKTGEIVQRVIIALLEPSETLEA